MIHLIYQPAFDAAHTIFRFLRLKDALSIKCIEFEKLRILDYYLLFPFQASHIKFKKSDAGLRKAAIALEDRRGYASLPSKEMLYNRMKGAHVAAIQTLAGKGAVSSDDLRYWVVCFEDYELSNTLTKRIEDENEGEKDTLEIVSALAKYDLLGKDGLKDRTGLAEYRHDKI